MKYSIILPVLYVIIAIMVFTTRRAAFRGTEISCVLLCFELTMWTEGTTFRKYFNTFQYANFKDLCIVYQRAFGYSEDLLLPCESCHIF